MTLLLLAAGAAAYWWWHTHNSRRPAGPRLGRRPVQGAGASADAHARALRTPAVRLATALGIRTRTETRARRFEIGAMGERHVASLLRPMTAEGWALLPDRRLPHGNANIDILAISPAGGVFVLDPKRWTSRHRLTVRNGRLWHGGQDVSSRMRGLVHETRTVSRLLAAQAVPIAVMDGPMLPGARLRFTYDGQTIRLVPAHDICTVLRGLDPAHTRTPRAARLTDTAERLLPPKI